MHLINEKHETVPTDWVKVLEKTGDEDEQSILKILVENNGTVFQGELVDKTGFSKSKVSLILDRLEARRLVERRRHGMSNAVVLK